MTAYDDFVALKHAGFKPPNGRGRCGWCAFHKPTQGHRDGCPMKKESTTMDEIDEKGGC